MVKNVDKKVGKNEDTITLSALLRSQLFQIKKLMESNEKIRKLNSELNKDNSPDEVI